MRHIVLIACASRKQERRARAAELYLSDLFQKSLRYARSLDPDEIYILSAKHGLVGLAEELEPYDVTLNTMPARERKAWSEQVLTQLEEVADLDRDRFTFLAGAKYRQHLAARVRHPHVPLEGLGIGKQLKFLKDAADAG